VQTVQNRAEPKRLVLKGLEPLHALARPARYLSG